MKSWIVIFLFLLSFNLYSQPKYSKALSGYINKAEDSGLLLYQNKGVIKLPYLSDIKAGFFDVKDNLIIVLDTKNVLYEVKIDSSTIIKRDLRDYNINNLSILSDESILISTQDGLYQYINNDNILVEESYIPFNNIIFTSLNNDDTVLVLNNRNIITVGTIDTLGSYQIQLKVGSILKRAFQYESYFIAQDEEGFSFLFDETGQYLEYPLWLSKTHLSLGNDGSFVYGYGEDNQLYLFDLERYYLSDHILPVKLPVVKQNDIFYSIDQSGLSPLNQSQDAMTVKLVNVEYLTGKNICSFQYNDGVILFFDLNKRTFIKPPSNIKDSIPLINIPVSNGVPASSLYIQRDQYGQFFYDDTNRKTILINLGEYESVYPLLQKDILLLFTHGKRIPVLYDLKVEN
ncbi:hypothetical protein [Spirochaeta cellobiosiphila]|uniref:hypothetical protein n=1 Tax=Spirochaeta cellobiosiphila TaxID=504483 RepID=UPI0003F72675|nr:hypothetical protein [Spirochaeta cellobiosiphila]